MTQATSTNWRERLTTPLALHAAGALILGAITLVLGIRLGFDYAATSGTSSNSAALKQVQLKALELQTAPLRGIDKRLDASREDMRTFYDKRIPASYSKIATRIGELQVASGVRLTRVQYTQDPPSGDLTGISMDAGISGGYPQIMRFVNSLERDSTFFVIRAMALQGQQGGTVNLRLRVSTWLRPADAAASGLPPTPADDADSKDEKSIAGKEGQ